MAENDSGRTDTLMSPSLASFVSDGYEEDVSELPEPDQTDAGAPPADLTVDALDPAATSSEGSEDAEHAGAPPADAASPDSDDPAGLDPSDNPLLKDAVSLTYVVDGQERTVDGIKRLGDLGAIVDAAYLPTLQQRLSERDHLFETNKAQYEKYANLERLTSWQTRDAQGNVQTITGQPAIQAMRVELAQVRASAATLYSVLNDPEHLYPLLQQQQNEDGSISVTLRPGAIEELNNRAELAALKAERTALSHFATVSAPPVPPEASIESLAMPTVDLTAQSLSVTGLTPDDKQFLAAQLPRYVRASTPEERQQHGHARVVDASFGALMQRMASANVAKAKDIATATDLSKSNAAKLAAAAQGRRQPAAPARPPQRHPTVSPQAQTESDAWDMQEDAMHRGLLINRR